MRWEAVIQHEHTGGALKVIQSQAPLFGYKEPFWTKFCTMPTPKGSCSTFTIH